ncbi:MAG: LytR/AlgR family response regulator transcription factor, partial [Bacteroidia bacterium]
HSNLEFTKSCYNGEDALHEINTKKYDIAFLDVNMPILNGIDVLKKINNKPAIIITTAYTRFAFEAYENDAVDYLQKPISEQRFKKAIEKALEYAKKRRLTVFEPIILKVDGIKQKINQEDIIYCQSMGNYTKFYLKNSNKPILVNETLASQLSTLNHDLFIQIHRTCIVNRAFIVRKKENMLILKNEFELPIGRKFMPTLNAELLK